TTRHESGCAPPSPPSPKEPAMTTSKVELLPLPEWRNARILNEWGRACVEANTEALRAELAEARDGWHMANGTADLAMKHRDAAEARAERLQEEIDNRWAMGV